MALLNYQSSRNRIEVNSFNVLRNDTSFTKTHSEIRSVMTVSWNWIRDAIRPMVRAEEGTSVVTYGTSPGSAWVELVANL